MYERIGILNAQVANPKIPAFKVYAFAGKDNGVPAGSVTIGPPAWNNATLYFSGNVFEAQRIQGGFRVAASGTFGARVGIREAATAFVEVKDGRVTVSGLPEPYNVENAPITQGSVWTSPGPVIDENEESPA